MASLPSWVIVHTRCLLLSKKNLKNQRPTLIFGHVIRTSELGKRSCCYLVRTTHFFVTTKGPAFSRQILHTPGIYNMGHTIYWFSLENHGHRKKIPVNWKSLADCEKNLAVIRCVRPDFPGPIYHPPSPTITETRSFADISRMEQQGVASLVRGDFWECTDHMHMAFDLSTKIDEVWEGTSDINPRAPPESLPVGWQSPV